MSTYGAMQDRIADEINRSDLTSQIQKAVQTAISFYEDERFWFNDSTYQYTTATASEVYTVSTVLDIDVVRVTINGDDVDLIARPFPYLDDVRDEGSTGYPREYAIFNDRMYLHPIPDATYTVQIFGCIRLTTISATADTSAWMTHGEELIRGRAKADIYANIIHDFDLAAIMSAQEERALTKLRQKSASKIATRSIVPTQF